MIDREDSPWYPTMRLFRQTTLGDWDGVFNRMADTLNQILIRARSAASEFSGPFVRWPRSAYEPRAQQLHGPRMHSLAPSGS